MFDGVKQSDITTFSSWFFVVFCMLTRTKHLYL